MLFKVLIIDDDILYTSVLETILPHDTFEVIVKNSSQEGLEAVRQVNPDVVVLDLMMPGLSGWQVCQTIRTFSQVPILIVSAVADSAKILEVLDAGADDYLLKPTTPGVLTSRLRTLARRATTNQTHDDAVDEA
jgi:DNA-binding response OmpR family regulator